MNEPQPTLFAASSSAIDPDELFAQVADDYTHRARSGERPTVEEYVERYPQIADLLRELLPTIAAVERVKNDSGPASHGRLVLGRRPERLGDFRIVRELGHGGMGIVYEAVQESLARNVAVKVLPPQTLVDERRVKRFEQEARLAAQLHHTNIVPIFGVGTSDGLHYYVMQLIDGPGLDRLLITQPGGRFEPREVARIGRDAARALHYAHEQGTLHRDIKPANLLVDRTNQIWLTDFGLAQALEADDHSTQAHVAGTLRYLPPERFHGVSNAQGDVYALGVTLYELACGRAPFTAETSVELMRQITESEAPRLRSLNPAVPRDLETIIAKTTARELNRRYRTADELADDLARFLEGMPIRARRVSTIERVWRWCGRNRIAAASIAAAVLSLMTLTVAAVVVSVQTGQLNADLTRAFDGERTARAAAESTSSTALAALDRVFERFAPQSSLIASFATVGEAGDENSDDGEKAAIPTVSPQIAAALDDLLPYYLKLADERGSDVGVRRQTASAFHRIGLIHARLGRLPEASAAWRGAEGAIAKLIAETTAAATLANLQCTAASISCDLGDLETAQERGDQGRTDYLKALSILKKIPTEQATFETRRESARAHLALGTKYMKGPPPVGPNGDDARGRGPPPGMGPPPGPGFGGPPPFGGPPSPGGPPPPGGPPDRPPFGPPPGGPFAGPHPPGGPPGPGMRPPGPFGPPPDDAPERREHLDAAFVLLAQLTKEQPNDAEVRLLSARCHRQLAKEGGPPGRREWESTDFQQATTLLRGLADEFPAVPDFAYELNETLVDFRVDELSQADWEPAGKQLREALVLSDKLVRDHPQTTAYAISSIHINHRLAAIERFQGRPAEQEQALRRALEGQRRLRVQFPDQYTHAAWEVRMTRSLAKLLFDTGRRAEATTVIQATIAGLVPFVGATPPNPSAVEAERELRRMLDGPPPAANATKKK